MLNKVWIKDNDTAWELVDVLAVGIEENENEKTLSVNAPLPAEGGGAGRLRTTVSVLKKDTMPYDISHSMEAENLHDLCMFNELHEGPLIDGLHRRYKKDLIYTNIGNNLLISINPCKPLDCYNTITPYLNNNIVPTQTHLQTADKPQPHIFSIANHALIEMKNNKALHATSVNQSIMVCGESGSGKTEASKYALQFLLEADKLNQERINDNNNTIQNLTTTMNNLTTSTTTPTSTTSSNIHTLSSVLLPTSTILEAFGHARTKHNHNSSRYGKYTKLQYSSDHRLISAYTETFLLEKTRVVSVSESESNFHVFYMLLNEKSEASKYQLESIADYKILNNTSNNTTTTSSRSNNNINSKERMDLTTLTSALQGIGLEVLEIREIWSLLAVLLHLGNIECRSIVDSSKPLVDDNYENVELISPTIKLSDLTTYLGRYYYTIYCCLYTMYCIAHMVSAILYYTYYIDILHYTHSLIYIYHNIHIP